MGMQRRGREQRRRAACLVCVCCLRRVSSMVSRVLASMGMHEGCRLHRVSGGLYTAAVLRGRTAYEIGERHGAAAGASGRVFDTWRAKSGGCMYKQDAAI